MGLKQTLNNFSFFYNMCSVEILFKFFLKEFMDSSSLIILYSSFIASECD